MKIISQGLLTSCIFVDIKNKDMDFNYIILATLPLLVSGVIALIFYEFYTKNQHKKIENKHQLNAQKELFPIQIQAHERLVLFLERIKLQNLVLRIKPLGTAQDYVLNLNAIIQQEFEHNVTQQIHISEKSWGAVFVAKTSAQNVLNNTLHENNNANALDIQRILIQKSKNETLPNIAILSLKKDLHSRV